MPPVANAPAVTVKPIASPKYELPSLARAVATLRTTHARAKVKSISRTRIDCQFAADQYGQADRGVVVAAGGVCAGEHHRHQHRPNRQRCERAGTGLRVDGDADGEDEEERPDELR
jgi:hypothetical protein